MKNFGEFLIETSFKTYMPQEPICEIYHYTSLNSIKSILFDDKDIENITLWASRYDCLNDVSEGSIAQKVYLDICYELYKRKEINEELFEFLKEITETDKSLFYKEINNTVKGQYLPNDRYITSFSLNGDSLAMWNYYSKGSKNEGCNIMMLASELYEGLLKTCNNKVVKINTYPVIYDKAKQKDIVRSFLKQALEFYNIHKNEIKNIISDFLLDCGLIFKSEHFKHEEEVRIIVDIPKSTSETALGNNFFEVKYRVSYGYIVPYIELKIPKECLGMGFINFFFA